MCPRITSGLSQKRARNLGKTAGTASSYSRKVGASMSRAVTSYKVKKIRGFSKLFHSIEDVKTAEVVLKKFKSKKSNVSFSELSGEIISEVKSSKVHNSQFINKQSVLKVINLLKRYGFLI